MNMELKPCPFCGSKASLYVSEKSGICVICIKCKATSSSYLDSISSLKFCGSATEHAIEAWNKRVEDKPITPEFIYECLGEFIGNPCDFSRNREELQEVKENIDWCDTHCDKVSAAEYWRHYFTIKQRRRQIQ